MGNLDSVLKQLQAAGLLVENVRVDTPAIERVKVEDDKGKQESGWYRVWSVLSKKGNTYYVGAYGNWKDGSNYSLEYENSELTQEDRVAIRKKQDEARKTARKEAIKQRQEAAVRANKIFSALPVKSNSAYLIRKKVGAFGVRFSRGVVVVPVQNIKSELVGLQFIYSDDKGKKFLSGTPKKQAFHVIGELSNTGKIYIAEGYSTAASIHMATNSSVVIAFDVGNLLPVCEVLRKEYPELTIVVCCDDDHKRSENIGLIQGCAAAKAVGGVAIKPNFDGYDPRGTDWNDLHVVAGLDEVKRQIESEVAVIIEVAAPPPSSNENKKEPSAANKKSTKKKSSEDYSPKAFSLSSKGLFFTDGEGKDSKVCEKLEILAESRDFDKNGFGLLVRFKNRDGDSVELNIARRLLVSDRSSLVQELLVDKGLSISSAQYTRGRLLYYLNSYVSDKRALLVDRFGWHGSAYLMPDKVIGEAEEILHYAGGKVVVNKAATAGTLKGWQENIGVYCRGNAALTLAICTAFTAPLMEWLGEQTFGIHYFGKSSSGKSTMSEAASSVCGGSDYWHTWLQTAVALESYGAQHSGFLLILDELSQADPYTVGDSVYTLANETSKARGASSGSLSSGQSRWKLVFLSNGEQDLEAHMAKAEKKVQAGQQVRLLNLPVTSYKTEKERKEKGCFDEMHGFESGKAFSAHIKDQVKINYGEPLLEFIKFLAALSDNRRKKLIQHIRRSCLEFEAAHLGKDVGGQVGRAAQKFGLLGTIGEIASKCGVTGWEKGVALRAADVMFKRWIDLRGGVGNLEENTLLKAVYNVLQTNAESKFTRWDARFDEVGGGKDEAVTDSHQPKTFTRWGYRRITVFDSEGEGRYSEEVFFIDKEAFRFGLCKEAGFNYKEVQDLLLEKGVLTTSPKRTYLFSKRLPGAKSAVGVYRIELCKFQDALKDID